MSTKRICVHLEGIRCFSYLSSCFFKRLCVAHSVELCFSGCLPNIARNAIVNCAELVTYDIIKELILTHNLMTGECKLMSPLWSFWLFSVCVCVFFFFPLINKANVLFSTDNMPCHFTAAFAAGFCTTLVASPVDVVKTRYMNSVPGQYSGALNCAMTMLLKEGPTAFYKGYVTHTFSESLLESPRVNLIVLLLLLYIYIFSLDSCPRIFAWVPGTSWCLWATNRSRELL